MSRLVFALVTFGCVDAWSTRRSTGLPGARGTDGRSFSLAAPLPSAPLIRPPDFGSTVDGPKETTGGRNLYLDEEDPSSRICYDAFYGDNAPNILFLPYLLTPKNQGIAATLEAYCRRKGFTYICADYYGVSRSGGTVMDGTISRWTNDAIRLLEKVTDGKTLLVGAAVGSWIMMRVALERPDLVAGLVGLSPDPDFTEELLWAGLSEEDKSAIMEKGTHSITWGVAEYEITRNLIMDGRQTLVLSKGKDSLDINCPVRLIHGTEDEEVPFETSVRLMEACKIDDVTLTLMKGASHFMETEDEMSELIQQVESAIAASENLEYDLTSPASG